MLIQKWQYWNEKAASQEKHLRLWTGHPTETFWRPNKVSKMAVKGMQHTNWNRFPLHIFPIQIQNFPAGPADLHLFKIYAGCILETVFEDMCSETINMTNKDINDEVTAVSLIQLAWKCSYVADTCDELAFFTLNVKQGISIGNYSHILIFI